MHGNALGNTVAKINFLAEGDLTESKMLIFNIDC